MPFQLANTSASLPLSWFLCIQVGDTFQQAVLQHVGNPVPQQGEVVLGRQGLLQHGRACTSHRYHCLKGFL